MIGWSIRKVDECRLSTRAKTCLLDAGLTTLGKVSEAEHPTLGFRHFPNLGKVTDREIRALLTEVRPREHYEASVEEEGDDREVMTLRFPPKEWIPKAEAVLGYIKDVQEHVAEAAEIITESAVPTIGAKHEFTVDVLFEQWDAATDNKTPLSRLIDEELGYHATVDGIREDNDGYAIATAVAKLKLDMERIVERRFSFELKERLKVIEQNLRDREARP